MIRSTTRREATRWLVAATFVSLAACSGDDPTVPSDSGPVAGDTGTVIVGLTDAPGDFAAYRVDVVALALTRADGARVETLAGPVAFDFTEYVDLTELLTVSAVPPGRYTDVSLELDYDGAEILVENDVGDVVPATGVVDADGAPLERLTLDVSFGERERLSVTRGALTRLTLDFDLQASHAVTFDADGAPTVAVSPVLSAELERGGGKPRRARGTLATVDPAAAELTVALRPYRVRFDADARFGELVVTTDEETRFDVDGERSSGSAGLERLAALGTGERVVVFGRDVTDPLRFVASEVRAGSSLPGAGRDVVRGVVLAREGERLTIGGAAVETDDRVLALDASIGVTLSPGTSIASSDAASADTSVVSVGQRITAWGELDGDGTGTLELSTEGGGLRLETTWLAGRVRATGNALELELERLAGRDPARFDFGGTGTSAGFDADPDAYEVDVGSLDIAGVESGTPLRLAGSVRPFGSAPADFEARTLIALADVTATLHVSWRPGVPRTEADGRLTGDDTGTALIVDVSTADRFRSVSRRGLRTPLDPGTTARVSLDDPAAVIVIAEPRRRRLVEAADVDATLDAAVADGREVRSIVAIGTWDERSATLAAERVTITLR